MNGKRMFKVIAPIERENGGGTYWMRCGTAFINKDNSINVYLDAMPLKFKPGDGVKLQLREYTDEDFRERDEKRASYSARGTLGSGGGHGSGLGTGGGLGTNLVPPSQPGLAAADGVPF